MKQKYNKLTPKEKKVIEEKETEMPFSGKYYKHSEKGVYLCKKCGTKLYKSDDKFDSGCGWPSFDDEIKGAIKKIPDKDGIRTEIICANCNAHLGHIFQGEKITPKNVRHCVNSISLNFKKSESSNKKNNIEVTYFAGGCFWSIEYYFQKQRGVISTKAGYMGGHTKNPTYKEVCRGKTEHTETVKIIFNSSVISFEKLAKDFFEIHDPTQVNRQCPDVGDQYRSAIFYTSDEQKQTAKKLISILEMKGYKITTQLAEAGDFWVAEDYHQKYYSKRNRNKTCATKQKIF